MSNPVTNREQGESDGNKPATSYQKEDPRSKTIQVRELVLMTPYPVEPGHTLISIVRVNAADWRLEMKANAAYIAEGDNAGIVINKPASIMDYNRNQSGQQERQQPPSAKMSFKVYLVNSETGKLTLEHRTLRFWLNNSTILDNNNDADHDDYNSTRTFANIRQESSHLAQTYFNQLIGSKPDDDFPKHYVGFIMKLMRLLKTFHRVIKMEVELRQLPYFDDDTSRSSSVDESSPGRGSPLTSQKILDIIESSYPNPISLKEICSTIEVDECIVRPFVDELASKEKINSTDDGQHFTRTTKPIDTKVNLVKQMPKVKKSQQPVIAIITAQYCEKLAVDSMISDKETFVRYRTTSSQDGSGYEQSSANYVYTLGNIGDHRVVSTKLTSIGHSRGALIAAGNATTRLLGTFPEIEYVFLVGCGGGVVNYTDFTSHVRLGDVVISHLPPIHHHHHAGTNGKKALDDYVYVHCRAKQQQDAQRASDRVGGDIPVSYSVHKDLKRAMNNNNGDSRSNNYEEYAQRGGQTDPDRELESGDNKLLEYDECHFRLWTPVRYDLQELTLKLWFQGLENPNNRIWEYYIDQGIKTLGQQDIDASRPAAVTDKLYMSIGSKGAIEVSHPEAGEEDVDLRQEGRPMCHFGPIGSGRPPASSEQLRQRMISEFHLRAFDSEFDPVVESIYGNCKENYIMIRGISDYKDGRKKKEWQQYSALVAAAFMKSIIVNLKPIDDKGAK